ncbi:MAG: hypothetical protein ABIO70_34375 [Pseudomonadota bacterium]
MLTDLLKRFFSGPIEHTVLAEASAGKVMLVGAISPADDLLASPIEGKACVAFYYRSTWEAPTRGAAITRLVEEAQVYAPAFFVALEDARVRVVPQQSDSFGNQDHQRLLNAAMPGFRAAEQLIKPRDRVRLHGRLHLDGEPWLELARVELLEAAPEAKQAAPRPRGAKTHPAAPGRRKRR